MKKLDISNAMIFSIENDLCKGLVCKAVEILQDEVKKRSGLKWEKTNKFHLDKFPLIIISTKDCIGSFNKINLLESLLDFSKKDNRSADGFLLKVIIPREYPLIVALGNDPRGTLFAVGCLLRNLFCQMAKVLVNSNLSIDTSPVYPVRGHQLGYCDLNNTYDSWNLKQFEQYIRELVFFGTNAVEIILPLPQDEKPNSLMPLPPWEMNIALSEMIDSFGLFLSLAAPVTDGDVSKIEERKRIMSRREKAFKSLKKIDALFVPGGDPGETPPQLLMPFLAELADLLRKYHPNAELWVSHQCFEIENREWFYNYLKRERPDWLTGVVYGPWTRDSLEHTRYEVPSCYKIRLYPDITHTVRCQFPVADWDFAFARTLNREPINPRPVDYWYIFNYCAPFINGFITYSEGVNDDFNKFLWSLLGWNPSLSLYEILKEYSRTFIGGIWEEEVSEGILYLEKNWRGPLSKNKQVRRTLTHWKKLEQKVSANVSKNWRFKQLLFRAYYDAFIQERLKFETALEKRSLNELKKVLHKKSKEHIKVALEILSKSDINEIPCRKFEKKIKLLADDLFNSIGIQLSVEKHKAKNEERGAVLDTMLTPLNNRKWLEHELNPLLREENFSVIENTVKKILFWKKTGKGSFYDDFGNPNQKTHLIKGSWEEDPGFVFNPQIDHSKRPDFEPLSWNYQAQALYDSPLKVRYENLISNLDYKLKVVYVGRFKPCMRLIANSKYEVHGPVSASEPPTVLEFKIPKQFIENGVLELAWYRADTKTRGPQVAEAWLIPEKIKM